jgi:hypothetical protein
MDIIFGLPVYDLATLIALSTASEPELQKKYRVRFVGMIPLRNRIKLMEASVAGKMFCWAKMILFA